MSYLWQQYASHPQFSRHIALQDEQGNVFTWQQLNNLLQHLTLDLQQQGVSINCIVALCGKNNLSLLLMYLACIQAGATVIGFNPYLSHEQLQQLCQDNQVKFYFSHNTAQFPDSIQNIQIDWSNLLSCKNIAPQSKDSFHGDLQRPATMTLTSGSSGWPKTIIHNLQAHLDNAAGVCRLMGFHQQHSWLLSLPLYHVSGQGIVWRWLLAGATLKLAGTDFYLNVSQANYVSLVPTQLQRFLAFLAGNPQHKWHTTHILLGGAHIPVTLCEQLHQYGIQSYSGYGMTEMASTIFAKASNQTGGVGQPLLGREFKIVQGEVWLRGAGLSMGYWKEGKIHSLLNTQGWLATQDRAEWKDGELFILGRLDNMFISGGENIQPEQIEACLRQHPHITQAFVLPISEPEFGQRPVALLETNCDFTRSRILELHTWLATKLEKFKLPIAYLDLNKEKCTTQGNIKITRQQLKQQLQQAWQNQEYIKI